MEEFESSEEVFILIDPSTSYVFHDFFKSWKYYMPLIKTQTYSNVLEIGKNYFLLIPYPIS